MSAPFNIYCDESCHLEHDLSSVMLLGCIWCPSSERRKYSNALRSIKERFKTRGELKWTKVSHSREEFFVEIVKYFFATPNLNFRCLVVKDKNKLNHSDYNQGSHDSFYYKMYYYLLRNIMSAKQKYNVYLDIKDTRSQIKINKLREVLCYSFHDFDQAIINNIQHVRSKEIELLQLTDFLMGSISYVNRKLSNNRSKLAIIEEIKRSSGLNLEYSTPPWEEKFNLFFFKPRVNS